MDASSCKDVMVKRIALLKQALSEIPINVNKYIGTNIKIVMTQLKYIKNVIIIM